MFFYDLLPIRFLKIYYQYLFLMVYFQNVSHGLPKIFSEWYTSKMLFISKICFSAFMNTKVWFQTFNAKIISIRCFGFKKDQVWWSRSMVVLKKMTLIFSTNLAAELIPDIVYLW